MTLLITAMTADKVVQASDRRLTWTDGRVYSDNANKAVCVQCRDARFTVAYTGLAHVGRVPSDEWLLDCLLAMSAFDMPVRMIVDNLKRNLTTAFSKKTQTTFVMAGFINAGHFPSLCRILRKIVFGPLRMPKNSFVSDVLILRRCAQAGHALLIQGAQQSVTRSILWEIKGVIRSRYLQRSTCEQIAGRLVSLIRKAADGQSRMHRTIGQDCMTTTMSLTQSGAFDAKYHPLGEASAIYAPHLLVPPGIAFKGIECGSSIFKY